jgi:hypothetical protein
MVAINVFLGVNICFKENSFKIPPALFAEGGIKIPLA